MKRILGVLIMFSILNNTQLFSKDEYAPKYRTIFSEKNKLAPFIYYKKGGARSSGYAFDHETEKELLRNEIVPLVQALMEDIRKSKYDFLKNNLSNSLISSIESFYIREGKSSDEGFVSLWIEDIKKLNSVTVFPLSYTYENKSLFESNQVVVAIEPFKYNPDGEKDRNEIRKGFYLLFFSTKSKRMMPNVVLIHKDEGSYKIDQPDSEDEDFYKKHYNNKIND